MEDVLCSKFVLRWDSHPQDNLFRGVVAFLQHGPLKSKEIVSSQVHIVLNQSFLLGISGR